MCRVVCGLIKEMTVTVISLACNERRILIDVHLKTVIILDYFIVTTMVIFITSIIITSLAIVVATGVFAISIIVMKAPVVPLEIIVLNTV